MEGKEASAGYVNKQVMAMAKWSSSLLGTPGDPTAPALELSQLRAQGLGY